MTYVVGLDVGSPNIPTAERWLHNVVATLGRTPTLIACTHAVSHPGPHVAVSLALAEPVARYRLPRRAAAVVTRDDIPPVVANRDVGSHLVRAAAQAAAEHAVKRAGRAVVYPGVERMTGTLQIEEVLANSAIERVTVIGELPPGMAEPPMEAKLETREYIRPHWSCGKLTLLVRPASGGFLVPFEPPPPIAER